MTEIVFDEVLEEREKSYKVVLNGIETWLAKVNCRHIEKNIFEVKSWLEKKIIAAAS